MPDNNGKEIKPSEWRVFLLKHIYNFIRILNIAEGFKKPLAAAFGGLLLPGF